MGNLNIFSQARFFGKKQIKISLSNIMKRIPEELNKYKITLNNNQNCLTYTHESSNSHGISLLLKELSHLNIEFSDIETKESSLEEIFVDLVRRESQ